eukprot:scaffold83967_cov72-Phaeocystis_antarctica.AAC.4
MAALRWRFRRRREVSPRQAASSMHAAAMDRHSHLRAPAPRHTACTRIAARCTRAYACCAFIPRAFACSLMVAASPTRAQ